MPRTVTVRRGVDLAREVREMRAQHARALSEPMLGAQMVHDPWIPPDYSLVARRAIQYAAAMAQRAGVIGAEASGLTTHSMRRPQPSASRPPTRRSNTPSRSASWPMIRTSRRCRHRKAWRQSDRQVL
jgi:hypothetical protein